MNKEFIPYEQALELKELGFDYESVSGYSYPNSENLLANAILYQQAFRWFREKYQLHSTITSISQESWQWHITKPGESLGKLYDEDFYTYEEAEIACLTKLIEIVKEVKMSKQSSVQWLFQKLWDTPKDKFEWQSIFLMAHQMHKEEIEECWLDGISNWDSEKEVEQYYNEKFNNNNE